MTPLLRLLERRPLGQRLALGFGVLVWMVAVLAGMELHSRRQLDREVQTLFDNELLGISFAREAQVAALQIDRAVRQAVTAPDPEAQQQALARLAQARSAVPRALEGLHLRIVRDTNRQNLREFEEGFATYSHTLDQALAHLRQGRTHEAQVLIDSPAYLAAGGRVSSELDQIVGIKGESARALAAQIQQSTTRGEQRSIAAILAGLGLAAALFALVRRSVVQPTERIRAAVEQMAAGRLDGEVPCTELPNETGELARSVQVLQAGARQTEALGWTRSNLVLIANTLQTATGCADLVHALFQHISPLMHVGHGALYLHDETTRRLRLVGAHALRSGPAPDTWIEAGQGLAGQCAVERAPIVLEDPPADYLRIGSCLGESAPVAIVIVPLLRNERLLGVLELATFAPFGPREQALLDGLLPMLAMNLEIVERHEATRQLLEETQRQSRALQTQAATLQEQTEELEAQQQALLNTEAWYRSIIQAAPDGMLVFNDNGFITLANSQAEAMFGYAPGELAGHTIETLVPEALRDQDAGSRKAHTATHSRPRTGRRKDGSSFPVELGLSLLPSVDGRGQSVCAAVRDITERLAAQQAVAENEQRLNLAVRGARLGLWDWDVATGRNGISDLWAEMVGYTVQELDDLEKSGVNVWLMLMHPEDKAAAESCFAQCISGELPDYRVEFRLRAKWGEWRWIQAIGRATQRDALGRAQRVVGIHQDVTERKQTEQELRQAKEALEEALRAARP